MSSPHAKDWPWLCWRKAGQGAVVTKSAYDGYYDLTGIAPGHYTLRVAAEQAARLQFAVPPPRALEMVPGGTVLAGVNFVLEAVGESQTPPP